MTRAETGLAHIAPIASELARYAQQSPFTSPGRYGPLLRGLPPDPRALARLVSGLLVHYRSPALRRARVLPRRLREVNLRYADRILRRMAELDDRPLLEPRPTSRRVIGCCRDFALLFCTLARHQGIPSRVRVGFATYFRSSPAGFHVDHTVAEYWDAGARRWKLVDAEQDERLLRENRIRFDPADVPRSQFLVGGVAWRMCRRDGVDPDSFGVDPGRPPNGLWFVRSRLLLDLAALNRRELLLWDSCRAGEPDYPLDARAYRQLDRMASALSPASVSLETARGLYRAKRWRHPRTVRCFSPVQRPYWDRLRA